jgi:hypothetical protein
MEVISIDGVEYVKASNIAKRFKYTADYVGQLCRGRKVDAKLIGRTWYVNPLSLTSHKSLRYTKDGLDDKTQSDTYNVSISRQVVNPVLNKNTAKSLAQNQGSEHYAKRIGWKPITYKEDDTDLLPSLVGGAKMSTRINVDIAGADKLEIEDQSKQAIDLESEPLPQFPLSGKLKINSAESYFEENENSEENIAIADDFEPEVKSAEENDESKYNDSKASSEATTKVALKLNRNNFPSVSPDRPNFTPNRVLNPVKTSAKPALSVPAGEESVPTPFPFGKLLFLVIIFLSLAAALLSVDLVISADHSSSVREFSFSLPQYLF